jgi:DNA invertase Pin-like site-specific DNA recombinase
MRKHNLCYARVSTAAQDETGQVRRQKAAECEKASHEKMTGTTADRPQLAKSVKQLALTGQTRRAVAQRICQT